MFRTIRFRIMAILSLLLLITMAVMLLSVYRSAYSLLRTNEMQYNVEVTGRTKDNFVQAMSGADRSAKLLLGDAEILTVLRDTAQPEDAEVSALKNTISSTLKNILYPSQYICGIHIIGARPWQFFSSIPSVDEAALRTLSSSFFEDTGDRRQAGSISGRREIAYYPGINRSVIQYMYPAYNISDGTLLGVIVIDLDYAVLEELFLLTSMKNEDKAMIVRSDGEVVFKYPYNIILTSVLDDYPQLLTEKESQFSGMVFGAEMLIVSDTIDYTDMHIVRMISLNRITRDTQSLQALITRVTIFSTLVSLILAAVISRWLTAPITLLAQAFRRAEDGDLSVRAHIPRRDELGQLGDSFNLMIEKLNQFFQRELEHQKKKSDMEMEVLEAQINPHFLYNTLDSIKWLAMLQNVNNIAEMTTALINLLKYNLSKDGPTVTLRDEIASVENYLCVQRYRYGSGIELKTELAPDTLDMPMLRFLLQPLVENCILHAFGHMDCMGTILITSAVEEGKLHIRVIDDGEGMDVERMLSAHAAKGTRFKNIGVSNIMERIRAHFGPEYMLRYVSAPGSGTTAELILPAREARL